MRKIQLKKSLAVLLGTSMMLGMACVAMADEEGVTLTFGAWGSEQEYESYAKMLENVHDVVPGVSKVELVTYASTNDFWNNLPSQIAAGTAPDMILPTDENAYEYISKGYFVPVDQDKVNKEGMNPAGFDVWTVDGELYGVPMDMQPTCLVLNLDLFEKYGFTEEDYPKTWDDVREISEKVSDPENNFYGLCLYLDESPFFVTQVVQGFGGSWGDGKTIDSEANAAGVQYVIDMFKDGLCVSPKQIGDDWDGTTFATGKALMTVGGVWYYGQMQAAAPDTNYIALPIPQQDPENPSSSLHSDAIVILKSCEHPDLAAEVANYMVRQEAQEMRAADTGCIPSNEELAAEYYETHPQLASLEGTESYSVSFGYPPETTQFNAAFVNALTAIVYDSSNTTTAAEMLADLQEQYGVE